MFTVSLTASTLPGFILNMIIVVLQTPIHILWVLLQTFDREILAGIF